MAKTLHMKLRKTWLKMLKAYAIGKMNKAKKLEQKVIALELEIAKDEKA